MLRCRVCGCTADSPCFHDAAETLPALWIEDDLCSVCAPQEYRRLEEVERAAEA